MRFNLIKFVTLLFFLCFVNAYGQDTISGKKPTELNEVVISGKYKKQKLEKVKFGKSNHAYVPYLDYYQNKFPDYLIEGYPQGTVEELALFFSTVKEDIHVRQFEKINVPKTEYNVYLFTDENGKRGKPINTVPILISLEEATQYGEKKVSLDVSKWNISSSSFFIRLEKISPNPCEKCFQYIPMLYTSGKKQAFLETGAEKKPVPKGITITDSFADKALRAELKILVNK